MEEIHVNDLKGVNINILLSEKFAIEFFRKIKESKIKLPKLYKELRPEMPFCTFKAILKPSYKNFRPLWLILDVCERIKINPNELEKNIISYRTKKSRNIVVEPKFPIRITPAFDMIVAHIMGDGHCFNIEGRDPYFGYKQFNSELLMNFLEKTESVFGKIKYENEYFPISKTIHLPSAISCIMMNYYNFKPEHFLEKNARLTTKMLENCKDNLLGILIAFIIDEGHVDSSSIVIGMYNIGLLEDLQKICRNLNYDNKITSDGKRSFLYILSDGVKKLWHDYLMLKKKYPEIKMGYKEDLIHDFIIRKEKLWRSKGSGENKNLIIELLNEKSRTVIEISKILRISRQGVKYHLSFLRKKGIVDIAGVGYAGGRIYKLKKYTKFAVRKKGISRQNGATQNFIIEMLKNKNMTTTEIAEKTEITRATVLHFLYNLEKIGIIERKGKEIHRTHPSIIWSLFDEKVNNRIRV
jgi:predicted ArsR family transcriptional regulator